MIRSYVTVPSPVKAVQWDGYNYFEIQKITKGDCRLLGPVSSPNLIVSTSSGAKSIWVGSWVVACEDGRIEAYSDSDFMARFERETNFEHLINIATNFDREHGHYYVYTRGIGVMFIELTPEEEELLAESDAWRKEREKLLRGGKDTL